MPNVFTSELHVLVIWGDNSELCIGLLTNEDNKIISVALIPAHGALINFTCHFQLLAWTLPYQDHMGFGLECSSLCFYFEFISHIGLHRWQPQLWAKFSSPNIGVNIKSSMQVIRITYKAFKAASTLDIDHTGIDALMTKQTKSLVVESRN